MDVQQILLGINDGLTVRRVFGEPIQVEDTTIIPAAFIQGGGGGGGKSPEEGGAGFGLSAKPAGAYVVRHGLVSWKPSIDVNRIVLGGQLVAIAALLTLNPLIRRWRLRRES